MDKEHKRKIIEEGVLAGLKSIAQHHDICNNKQDNPINVFSNIMSQEDMFKFTKELCNYMCSKYEHSSLKELKLVAINDMFADYSPRLPTGATLPNFLCFRCRYCR